MNDFTVYCHIFPNDKKYIGITRQSVYRRWSNGLGYLTSPLMNNAIQKYGWHNIEHKILYTNLTKEQAEKMEMKLISEWKTNNIKYGYNILSGGNVSNGITKDGKKRISNSRKGKKLSDEIKHKMKMSHLKIKHYNNRKINQYRLNGKLIKIWNSSSEIQRILNIPHQNIIKVCQNSTTRKTAGGFKWSYNETEVINHE